MKKFIAVALSCAIIGISTLYAGQIQCASFQSATAPKTGYGYAYKMVAGPPPMLKQTEQEIIANGPLVQFMVTWQVSLVAPNATLTPGTNYTWKIRDANLAGRNIATDPLLSSGSMIAQ